jgi:hypothetical protein
MYGILFLGKFEKLLFLVVFGEWSNCRSDFIFEDPVGGFAFGMSYIGFRGQVVFSRVTGILGTQYGQWHQCSIEAILSTLKFQGLVAFWHGQEDLFM